MNATYYIPGHMVTLYVETSCNKCVATAYILNESTDQQAHADGIYRWINRPWGDEQANAALDALQNLKTQLEYEAVEGFKRARNYARMSAKRRKDFDTLPHPWVDAANAAIAVFREKKCTSRGIDVLNGIKPDPLPCTGDGWKAYRDQAGFTWLEITEKVRDVLEPGIVCGVSPSGDILKVQNVPQRFAAALANLCDIGAPSAKWWDALPCRSCMDYAAKNAKANGADDPMSLFALALSMI